MVSEPEQIEFPESLMKQAMRGDELPAGLDYPEQIIYVELRNLYAAYRMQVVTVEAATREKKELMQNYKAFKWQWELVQQDAEIRARTSEARAAYRKNRTLENADALILALEGVAV